MNANATAAIAFVIIDTSFNVAPASPGVVSAIVPVASEMNSDVVAMSSIGIA